LVKQAGILFGARHYSDYHFLLTLSDHVAHFGLEHHESNDSRVDERSLIEEDGRKLTAGLLPHEYVHSWNGKYRRPADLATPDYEQPMQTDLLWVYEGLTSYLGDMLAARSGERTPALARDALAQIAADLDHRSGRVWRNLQDTADGVPSMQNAPRAWEDYRRPLDYYDEDVLNWLWADVIIRQQTKGAKSLDDFCKLFYGAPGGPPMVKTYIFDDVVNALNQVQAHDWRGFFNDRVRKVTEHAPLGGIANSGWMVVYNDQPNLIAKLREQEGRSFDASASLGLVINKDGVVMDAIEDGIAAKNGIGPGMKVTAVNGRRYSEEFLLAAMKESQNSHQPIQLLMENTEYFRTVSLDYFDGPRHPHLIRDNGKPDMLSAIFGPKVTTPPPPIVGAE
jgi:predicted metalloprotease with PDZ domain